MNHDSYPDSYIRGILNTVKTIAMVGFSPKESRPSYFVFKYLIERGYRMIPVNPGHAGKELLGPDRSMPGLPTSPSRSTWSISSAPRNVLPIVQEALALKPQPQVIWMQLTVRNDEAAALAEDAGLKVVMNRCPKIEYGRLSSEISWIGVNSRTLTSKSAQILPAVASSAWGIGHDPCRAAPPMPPPGAEGRRRQRLSREPRAGIEFPSMAAVG